MTERSTVEEQLGDEFWTVPEGVLDATFDLIRTTAASALREEVRERNGGALDYMLVERLSFMYAHLRQRESDTENVITDRNRREMLKDWLEFSTQIKKLWHTEDKDNQTDVLLKKINVAVSKALQELPETQGRQVRENLASEFERAGL